MSPSLHVDTDDEARLTKFSVMIYERLDWLVSVLLKGA